MRRLLSSVLLLAACAPSPPPVAGAGARATAGPVPPAAAPQAESAPPEPVVDVVPSPWEFEPGRCVRPERTPASAEAVFPPRGGPQLGGPFAGLRFGMSEADAERAAPAMKDALYVHYVAEQGPSRRSTRSGSWVPVGSARARIRISEGGTGLGMVEILYESEAKARAELEAAWGKPLAGDSGFGWLFWHHPEAGVRAVLMKNDGGDRSRLELSSYRPLAKVLERALVTRAGKPIAGASRQDLCDLPIALARHERETDYSLPATEHSSGKTPLVVRWKDGRVERYGFQLDFTYHRPVHDEIARLLEKRLGAPAAVESGGRECLRFGGDPAVIACDGRKSLPRPTTVWTIEVAPAEAR